MKTLIPYNDLGAHHEHHREEYLAAMGDVLDAGAFAGGPFVEAFEKEFADYCGTDYCVGTGNGTVALWLALLAEGIGPGDEVITTPMTFIATAEAISWAGATPVFVDIEESSCNIDPQEIEAAISRRTKAIMPVHLFGQVARMKPILEIAEKHGLAVIEDAAQAHGARYRGMRAGSIGKAGCFSFYPGKNLGAFGEAGCVVTNDPEIYRKAKILRDHGQSQKYHHETIGWNGRMDGIQAAILRLKLRHLDRNNDLRRAHAGKYSDLLRSTDGITLPTVCDDSEHAFHIYSVRVPMRDKVLEKMEVEGIQCGIHYPVPLHRQAAYAQLGHGPGSFPVAERCAESFLSLPMFPELTNAQIAVVAESLHRSMPTALAA